MKVSWNSAKIDNIFYVNIERKLFGVDAALTQIFTFNKMQWYLVSSRYQKLHLWDILHVIQWIKNIYIKETEAYNVFIHVSDVPKNRLK